MLTEPALRDVPARIRRGYRGGGGMSLRGYLILMAGYGTAVAGGVAAARALGRRPPSRVPLADVALMAVATFRISRLLTKDTITSPLRAPFTRFQSAAGEGEINEEPRGNGVRHAVGELASCPFCASVWTATGLTAGYVFAPRFTRLVSMAATAVTGSDFMQLAWAKARAAVH